MAMFFITGQAHTGKTQRLLKELINEASQRDLNKVLIICPQVGAAAQMARDIATPGNPLYQIASDSSIRAVETTETNRWLASLWAEHGDRRAIVDSTERNRILRAVAADYQNQLKEEGKRYEFLSKAGVLNAISSVLLKHGTAPESTIFSAAIRDNMGDSYVALVAKYQVELDNAGYVERADAARWLSRQEIFLDCVVGINGFTSISTELLMLIRSLSSTNSIGVAVLYDGDIPAIHAGELLIKSLCHDCGPADLRAQLKLETEFRPSDCAARIFSDQPSLYTKFSEKCAVKLSVAQGQAAEDALILSEVEDKLNRFEPEEIAIIFRKPNINIWNLVTLIEQREIPYNLDLRPSFLSTAYGAAFNDLVDYIKTESAQKVMTQPLSRSRAYRLGAFLQSPYSGWQAEQFNELDAELRGKSQILIDPIYLLMEREYKGHPNKFYNQTIALAQKALTEGSLQHWTDLIDLMLDNSMRLQRPTRLVASLNYAAHHALYDALSECIKPKKGQDGGFTGGPKEGVVDVDAFLALLPDLTLSITETRGSAGRLVITDAARMRSRKAKAVIFAGLAAESYQKDVRETFGNAITRRLRMEDAAEAVPTSQEEHRLEEQLFAYQVISRAGEEISFIAQVANERGDYLAPSILLDEILNDDYFSSLNQQEEKHPLDAYSELGIDTCYPVDLRARRIRFGFGEPNSCKDQSSARYTKIGRMRGSSPIQPSEYWDKSGVQSPEAPQEFSPSALERYVHCPYGWFAGRYLSDDQLDSGIEPRTTGTRIHKLIQFFYESWQEDHGTMVLEEHDLSVVNKKLREIAEDDEFKMGNLDFENLALSDRAQIEACIIKAEERIIADTVSRVVETDEVEPTFFEFKLSTMREANNEQDQVGQAENAIVGGVPIRGSIDRVDLAGGQKGMGSAEGNLMYVYDYKGNIAEHAGKTMLVNGKIQAPIYLIAASKVLNAKPAGYAYLSYSSLDEAGAGNREAFLKDPYPEKDKKGTAAHSSEEFTEELEAVEALVAKAAAGMMAGDIPIATSESLTGYIVDSKAKGCTYCAYKNCPALINKEDEGDE